MSYTTIEGLHQILAIIHNKYFVIHTSFFIILHLMSLVMIFNLVFNEHYFNQKKKKEDNKRHVSLKFLLD